MREKGKERGKVQITVNGGGNSIEVSKHDDGCGCILHMDTVGL